MAEFAPALSIVIPVHNGSQSLARCLAAVFAQISGTDEVIVVDDASTDDVAAVANRFPATVIRLDRQSGAAAARNRGAERATRPVLFFVDADVVVHSGAIARGRAHFADPAIAGVIGSYDDAPEVRTLISRFKNLAHHYFHQRAAGRVGSFWGACGFIKRDVFNAVGGFDERRFLRPSIEDVELGWRVSDRQGQVVLDAEILVTHLKHWTLGTLIKTDIVYRAMPWVQWSLDRRRFDAELNAGRLQQLALLVAVLLIASGIAAVPSSSARVAFVGLATLAFVINRRLFRLFYRKGGVGLLVAGFMLQQLYYLCALVGVLLGVASFCWPGRRTVAVPPARVGV